MCFQKTNQQNVFLHFAILSPPPRPSAHEAPLLLIIRSFFKQAKAIEKNICKIEHVGQFPLISNQCLLYVLWNQTLLQSRFAPKCKMIFFIMSVKTQRKTLRETPYFSLTCVSQQWSSSQFLKLRKVRGVYFDRYIPLIVKQSLDLDGKKLIVIPEASRFSLYIFAVAAVDITLLQKNATSLKEKS